MSMKMMIKCIFALKSCFLYLILFVHFSILVFFPFLNKEIRKNSYQDCKQYVGTGINTSIAVSDGLDPSILCRNVEKEPPVREEKAGKVVYIPPESAFLTLIW